MIYLELIYLKFNFIFIFIYYIKKINYNNIYKYKYLKYYKNVRRRRGR